MVKSEQIYSPQNYLEGITGQCYIINGDNDIDFIQKVFEVEGYELWDYPMSEIDHIVENNIDVVLVECMVWDDDEGEYKHIYRWFEVTPDFEQEYDEEE